MLQNGLVHFIADTIHLYNFPNCPLMCMCQTENNWNSKCFLAIYRNFHNLFGESKVSLFHNIYSCLRFGNQTDSLVACCVKGAATKAYHLPMCNSRKAITVPLLFPVGICTRNLRQFTNNSTCGHRCKSLNVVLVFKNLLQVGKPRNSWS